MFYHSRLDAWILISAIVGITEDLQQWPSSHTPAADGMNANRQFKTLVIFDRFWGISGRFRNSRACQGRWLCSSLCSSRLQVDCQ